MGIVKKNGIMIVDFALHRLDEGYELREAIHEASIERFRPIIMTTLAALHGCGADSTWLRRGRSIAPPARSRYRRRLDRFAVDHALHHAGHLPGLEWFQENVLDRVPFLRSAHFHEHEFTHKPDPGHPTPVTTG